MNKKIISFIVAVTLLAGGSYWYYSKQAVSVVSQNSSTSGIQIYNAKDHKAFIEKQFKENWYWLISTPEYDIHHMMDTQSPNNYEPKYFGKMKIIVLHEEGHPVGFGTYYMQSPAIGDILFIAVDKDFRGKRYAEKLVNACIDDLKKMGAKVVKLATRVDNKGARTLYDRMKFVETGERRGFIHYRMEV